MSEFGREICGDRNLAQSREWLVTNGIGGYASGTVAGMLTRRYHGLLVAALNPPYFQYTLHRATQPLKLTLKALVNYRDYHGGTQSNGWQMDVTTIESGIGVTAYPGAVPLYLLGDRAQALPNHNWYYGFDLAWERDRGLSDREDHLHAATFEVTLNRGESLTGLRQFIVFKSLKLFIYQCFYVKKSWRLLNELWVVGLFRGTPGWTIVKTRPNELLCHREIHERQRSQPDIPTVGERAQKAL